MLPGGVSELLPYALVTNLFLRNSDSYVEFDVSIPANFDLDNIIVVGAVDQAGDPTDFTSGGRNVRVYDLVVAQTGGGPGIASEVPAKYVYDYMFQGQNLGQGFAASTMMLLTVALVVVPWAILEFGGKKQNG